MKKKLRENFGDAFATARVEGVIMGLGAGQKYCVEWSNLINELTC